MFFRKILKTRKDKPAKFFQAKGNLVVNPDIEIIYGEPAILHQSKKHAKLYEKPPALRQQDYESADESSYYDEEVKRFFITRRCQNGSVESMIVSHDFDKPETVLARPFEYPDPKNPEKMIIHPFLLQVMTFKRMVVKSTIPGEEDRTDMGDGVTLQELGYMYKEDLSEKEIFKRESRDLFPHAPRQSDIVQGAMGNCFLLASINTLFALDVIHNTTRGRDFILNMMKQQPDGSVIVRLHHPITLQPIYVRVENALHEKYSLNGLMRETISHEAPWVHILEKAYAGLGFLNYTRKHKEQNNKFNAVIHTDSGEVALSPASFLALYGEGGQADFAMQILTGQKTTTEFIVDQENREQFLKGYPFPYYDLQVDELLGEVSNPVHNALKRFPQYDRRKTPEYKINEQDFNTLYEAALEEYQKKPSFESVFMSQDSCNEFKRYGFYQAFEGNHNLLYEWVAYTNLLHMYYPDQFKILCELWCVNKIDVPNTIEQLAEVIAKIEEMRPAPPTRVLQRFLNYIYASEIKNEREIHRFKGPLASGQYTQAQYDLFNKLRAAIDQGRIITAGTHERFDKDAVGLVSNHAYAITNVSHKLVNGKVLLMISLRNPWGHTGRNYQFVPDGLGGAQCIPKEIEEGEFEIDITDFQKYFNEFSMGDLPVVEAANNGVPLPPVDITCFPFKGLRAEQKDLFVMTLSTQDKKENKALLANQGIQDLYELSRFLQQRLVEHKLRLKNNPVLANDIKRRIKTERNLLRQVRSRFNLRITQNKATFKMISENSKRYLKQQSNRQNFFSKCFNVVKSKLDMFFTRGKYTNNFLNIYANHNQYQKSINILLSDFSRLTRDDQNTFMQLLLKQPSQNQDLILQSQPFAVLAEIKQLTEGNEVSTLFGADKNADKRASLQEKLKNMLDNVTTNIENRYNTKIYGATMDPILKLIYMFLRKNRQILTAIMEFSGVPKEHLETPNLQISILPHYDNQYNVRVSLPTGGFSQPVTLPSQEVLSLAWAQLSHDQKDKLRDALLLNDGLSPRSKSSS